MSADWAKLETHVVNGAFPLQRCVGRTERSGVFLTQSTPHAPSAAALKLIPFDPKSAPSQLSQWRTAVELSHPHLLRIFEAGECRIDEQRYLYARMEYADQTLAQVLEGRALTEDEVREMLVPTLDALEYLHRRGLVHGGLKPSNFLVVGDRLKLSSDTVRALGDSGTDASTEADLHALGLTVCEALTRLRPSKLPPPDLPASFRQIVSRPTVAEWQAGLRGEAPAVEPVSAARSSATRLVIRVELPPEEEQKADAAPQRGSWRVLPLAVTAAVLVALGWVGYRAFSTREVAHEPSRTDAPVAAVPPVAAPVAAPVLPAVSTPVEAPPPAKTTPAAGAGVNEVLPEISRSSLDSIHGTLRVSVRVGIGKDGTVTSATADDPGPSRYFERRALEAAKKWTFAPAATEDRRSVVVRFAFTRSGVTASVGPQP